MVASAVIIELSANTPSPLNQVARFMMLSSFQFELVLSSDPWKANALGSWLLAVGSWLLALGPWLLALLSGPRFLLQTRA
jgi:hypothetical protein